MQMRRQRDSETLPRHRHKLSRETVQKAQRRRILRATADAVADQGYRAATVADIVRRAGVSTRTFYELYADKEAAVCAVYDTVDGIFEHYYKSPDVPRAADPRGNSTVTLQPARASAPR